MPSNNSLESTFNQVLILIYVFISLYLYLLNEIEIKEKSFG